LISSEQEAISVTDILIRNIDDDDLRHIDALAAELGISRSELLRREPKTWRGGMRCSRSPSSTSAALWTWRRASSTRI
jgi:hypothetical protein